VNGNPFFYYTPDKFTDTQLHLIDLLKWKIPKICEQLQPEELKEAIVTIKQGKIMISGIDENAFLVSMIGRDNKNASQTRNISEVFSVWSAAIKHIWDGKPVEDSTTVGYPQEVIDKLNKLGRLLFKEQFEHTSKYKKNIEILSFIREKIKNVVGAAAVEEIITLVFNDIGTTPAYMDERMWRRFVDMVINEHIRKLNGDIVGDECEKTWIHELDSKLSSFV
jgi:hypothetical protein